MDILVYHNEFFSWSIFSKKLGYFPVLIYELST
jgi:hypothetical protein